MATSNAQRYLANGGDDTDIGLSMFWGTVIERFHAKTLLYNSVESDGGVGSMSMPTNVISSQVVNSGKSWEFPIIGEDPTPETHTPGVELLGQNVALDKGTIVIDDIVVSHYDLAHDHTQLSHFSVLEPFAVKLGRSLANQFDERLFQLAVLTARSAASTGFHNGGNRVTRSAATVAIAYAATATGAQQLSADIAQLARIMDEDNVPEEGRYLAITPYARQVLTLGLETSWFSKDFSDPTVSSLNQRRVGLLHGFILMGPSNNIPIGQTSAITTGPSQYQGNFVATGTGEPVAIALCGADEGSAAIGYVAAGDEKLNPLYAYRFYDERRNTTFMKAQMMVGAGSLAPWCAGAVEVVP